MRKKKETADPSGKNQKRPRDDSFSSFAGLYCGEKNCRLVMALAMTFSWIWIRSEFAEVMPRIVKTSLSRARVVTVTDQSWMVATQQNIRDMRAAKLQLDFVMFDTWMQHPKKNLPESDPLTFTSLVDWYVRNGGADGSHP